MLNNIIKQKSQQWLQSEHCKVIDFIKYIRSQGKLREPQIEAIETYLFLKLAGLNKPLWQLFAEGFFTPKSDLTRLNINQVAREFLSTHMEAQALFDFADQYLPELKKVLLDKPESLDYQQIIKRIFYNVSYADYLLSLPMGAGKTYLMAAFIYIDLYFAQNEPDNPAFAHNFLVLIPAGLKSSIGPSLKTIEHFDPSWVLPEPAASQLKRVLKFAVLDESKSARKSNKARNPNAQKVNQCLPNPFGQVFVVNAEKVVLDRLDLSKQSELLEKSADERDRFANELRNLIGTIPHLSIMIDEVHHAATDDIKLRQVVNQWHDKGNITTVLGFSGTPYLSTTDKIQVTDTLYFKFSQITNTVYYYPLSLAIRQFLKKPQVKIGQNLDRLQVIKQGVEDFQRQYQHKIYGNGTTAKIVIYCSNIEVLEEEIYPFLVNELRLNPVEILKYHGGNKRYSLPKEHELAFRSLDLAISPKRYILLVQVGKEGWDCRSLTAVILSQKAIALKIWCYKRLAVVCVKWTRAVWRPP